MVILMQLTIRRNGHSFLNTAYEAHKPQDDHVNTQRGRLNERCFFYHGAMLVRREVNDMEVHLSKTESLAGTDEG